MKLVFDNIVELEQFLQFSAHVGKFFVTAPPVQSVDPAADFYRAPDDVASIIAAMGGLPPAHPLDDVIAEQLAAVSRATGIPVDLLTGAEPPNDEAPAGTMGCEEPEAPKRKRRTKAEIEAEKAGNVPAAGQTTMSAEPSASESPSSSETAAGESLKAEPQIINTAPPGNPFAQSPSTQAVLDAPNQQAATLAGIAAMQTGVASNTVDDRAAELLAAGTYADGLEHLRYCQAFIQKHGLPKYNEGFTGALGANIIAYEPAQRAQHVAVLESLVA